MEDHGVVSTDTIPTETDLLLEYFRYEKATKQDVVQCRDFLSEYDKHVEGEDGLLYRYNSNHFILGDRTQGVCLVGRLHISYSTYHVRDASDALNGRFFDFRDADRKVSIFRLGLTGTSGRLTFIGEWYAVVMKFVPSKEVERHLNHLGIYLEFKRGVANDLMVLLDADSRDLPEPGLSKAALLDDDAIYGSVTYPGRG